MPKLDMYTINNFSLSRVEDMESFLLNHHIVCFQGSLRGLVAAMSGNVDCILGLKGWALYTGRMRVWI